SPLKEQKSQGIHIQDFWFKYTKTAHDAGNNLRKMFGLRAEGAFKERTKSIQLISKKSNKKAEVLRIASLRQ
ncbi:MAG: hypothetical protein PHH21_03155, partial [Candidatus Pacebacteria bacterium]|nr:hypothetical protein [Candidatus Paceibacterota bacterium]